MLGSLLSFSSPNPQFKLVTARCSRCCLSDSFSVALFILFLHSATSSGFGKEGPGLLAFLVLSFLLLGCFLLCSLALLWFGARAFSLRCRGLLFLFVGPRLLGSAMAPDGSRRLKAKL